MLEKVKKFVKDHEEMIITIAVPALTAGVCTTTAYIYGYKTGADALRVVGAHEGTRDGRSALYLRHKNDLYTILKKSADQ